MEKLLQQILEGQKQLFGEVAKINQGLTETNQRVTAIDQKITETNQRVAAIDQKITETNQRVTAIDQKIAETNQRVAAIDQKVSEVNQRLDNMPTKADLEKTIIEQQKDIIAMLERTATKDSIIKLDTKIGILNNKLLETETDVALLKVAR